MSVPYLLFAYKSLPSGMDSRIKKRASADTQNGHRQRLLVRFPGIQASAEIDTFFRAKDETMLAPGGISHSGPGGNRQLWPDENSQS